MLFFLEPDQEKKIGPLFSEEFEKTGPCVNTKICAFILLKRILSAQFFTDNDLIFFSKADREKQFQPMFSDEFQGSGTCPSSAVTRLHFYFFLSAFGQHTLCRRRSDFFLRRQTGKEV